MVQLWLSWRQVQHDMRDDSEIKSFAADCDSTVRRVSVLLIGASGPGKYTFGLLRQWAINISAAWKDRGVPYEIYLIARPDGTLSAPVVRSTP